MIYGDAGSRTKHGMGYSHIYAHRGGIAVRFRVAIPLGVYIVTFMAIVYLVWILSATPEPERPCVTVDAISGSLVKVGGTWVMEDGEWVKVRGKWYEFTWWNSTPQTRGELSLLEVGDKIRIGRSDEIERC